jgi:hypothetical protein
LIVDLDATAIEGRNSNGVIRRFGERLHVIVGDQHHMALSQQLESLDNPGHEIVRDAGKGFVEDDQEGFGIMEGSLDNQFKQQHLALSATQSRSEFSGQGASHGNLGGRAFGLVGLPEGELGGVKARDAGDANIGSNLMVLANVDTLGVLVQVIEEGGFATSRAGTKTKKPIIGKYLSGTQTIPRVNAPSYYCGQRHDFGLSSFISYSPIEL